MTTRPDINDLFGLLDKWRHFPAFPLEARSEVFFAMFLPTVLEHRFKIGIKSQIIPQFPLRKESEDKEKDYNLSNKVDFFALSEDGKRAFLIELKTDMNSWRKGQDCYLARAAEKHVDEILCDLKEIVKRSKEKQKYYHLLNALCELELIRVYDLKSKIYPKVVSGVSNLIDDICILKTPCKLEVVYVQPRSCKKREVDGFKYIYFKEFAEIVKNQGELGEQFARYLREWITAPANHPPQ